MRNSLLAIGLFLVTLINANAQRLGIHYTAQELSIWRERAKTGPFKTLGDAGTNTPGDWDRITKNANTFLANPSAERYRGYTGGGCFPQAINGQYDPKSTGNELRDAAFYYLITQDRKYADAVKKELLAQASEPLTDFSNKSRWCPGALADINPSFFIAGWMNRLLFAYDYTKDVYTSTERQKLDTWFRNAATYFQTNVDPALDKLFVNRASGNYALTSYGQSKLALQKEIWHGGPKYASIGAFYNNRRGAMTVFITSVGAMQNNESFKATGRRFAKEFLMFSTFPNGDITELERWRDDFPDQGISYAYYSVGQLVVLADLLARTGDMSVYNFKTSEGYGPFKGGEKTVKLVMQNALKYMDGTHNRTTKGTSATRIDGIDTGRNWYMASEVFLAQGNVYYKDNYIKNGYMKTNPGSTPFKVKPAGVGSESPYNGPIGSPFPAQLFLFGQMEGKVNPYSNTTLATTAPAPAPTTTTSPTTTAPAPTTTTSPTTTAPAPTTTTTTSSKLYRAINLNGTAVTVDGIAFESKAAANVTFTGRALENQNVVLNPATDANRAKMIRSSVWERNGALKVNIAAVPKGQYDVYFYTWEDNASETFSVSLEGKKVLDYTSGTAGKWKKHGPYRVAMSDGTLNLTTAGGAINLSGIEMRVVTTTTSIASSETGIDSNEEVTEIRVYPNPFTSKIAVQVPAAASELKEVSITNKAGRTVYEEAQLKTDKARRFDFDLASTNLPKGTYLLKMVFADGKQELVKMYKQ